MHDTEPTLIPAAPPQGLAALEARVRQDLQWLALPGKSWTPATVRDGVPVIDVAIIGGGQAGMAASVALSHLGIPNVIYDQSPKDFEGPWATTARMETLRSPKELTGPALGLPALTFRAWFEAQFGLAAWEARPPVRLAYQRSMEAEPGRRPRRSQRRARLQLRNGAGPDGAGSAWPRSESQCAFRLRLGGVLAGRA